MYGLDVQKPNLLIGALANSSVGVCDLSGGSNAEPTTSGFETVTSLRAAGWDVAVNGEPLLVGKEQLGTYHPDTVGGWFWDGDLDSNGYPIITNHTTETPSDNLAFAVTEIKLKGFLEKEKNN